MNRSVEDYYPSVAGILVGLGISYAEKKWQLRLSTTAPQLFSAAINVSAIAIGFLATSQSILLTIPDSKLVSAMRKTQHFTRLVGFISSAIQYSFVLAILSAASLAIDFSAVTTWHRWVLLLWTILAMTSVFAYYRVIGLLLKVLQPQPEGQSDAGHVLDTEVDPNS